MAQLETQGEPGRGGSTSADRGRWGQVLPGLLTTTTVTVLMCASVFQRRSRSGFLDELETVRGDALTAPGGEVATAVAMADAAAAQARLDGESDEDEPEWHGWPGQEDAGDETGDVWAQPSPHPIRPQEMWHASGSPAKFAEPGERTDPEVTRTEGFESKAGFTAGAPGPEHDHPHAGRPDPAPAEPRSAEPGGRRRFARFRPAAQPTDADARFADDPELPVIPAVDAQGLLGGPVGRRDRSGRERRPLPPARPLEAPAERPDDPSSLAEVPLPPAAVLPEAGSDAEAPQAAPVEPTVVAIAPDPAPTPDPAPMSAPSELVIDERSELAVGATVVRLGDASRTSMEHGDHGPVLQVDEGSCWVTVRGDGPRVPVQVHLPHGDLVVAVGGRALAVVEADRSCFVVIVDGDAELRGTGANLSLASGAMVLLSEDGDPQVDRADDDELASDPLVARNLELDAAS